MSENLWQPRQWERPVIEGLSPSITEFVGIRGNPFHFYVHNRRGGGIAASGQGATLEETQAACDAAVTRLLADAPRALLKRMNETKAELVKHLGDCDECLSRAACPEAVRLRRELERLTAAVREAGQTLSLVPAGA